MKEKAINEMTLKEAVRILQAHNNRRMWLRKNAISHSKVTEALKIAINILKPFTI